SGVGFDCSCWITSLKKNYGQPSQPQAAAGRNFPFSVPKGTSPDSFKEGAGRQGFLCSSPSGSPPVANEVFLDSSYFGNFRHEA
ncbi:MAG: hypothetical protein VX050_02445, partial [Planctomycetota bacterium]|nr:hypothetical protein [Planctomycetota bacterium]